VAAAPETTYTEIDGSNLAYQVIGDGARDLLYVAEARAPVDLVWDDPLAAHGLRRLSRLGRLIAFDQRGLGSSDVVDFGDLPAIQAWMDDFRAVMEATRSERATIIAGEAEMGLAAMLFAASHPDRVAGLVLINPYARFLRSPEQPWALPVARRDAYVEGFARAVGRGSNANTLAPSRADDPVFRRWFARGERLGAPPGTAARMFRGFISSDITHVLPTIRTPTLVLHRRDNPHVRIEHGRRIAERIPRARLVELAGADDVWYSGDVDALVDAIEAFVGGDDHAATGGERMLATVLFTDIVGSTHRAAEMGDAAWSAMLDAHDEIVRGHVSAYGGRWVKSLGDGALATFDGPARAISCAVGMRDALAARGVPVRAGLHTGEVERRGDDIGGIAVHIAARIAGLAESDELLVSGAVPPLVVGARLHFRNAGTHELKGVPDAWQVFAVDDA
jgi:class 3 adenylate cyclase